MFLRLTLGGFLTLAEILDQGFHVLGVLFLIGQNLFHEAAAGGVLIAEVADDFRVRLNGNAFGYQVLLDHVDEGLPFDVLGVTVRDQTIGIEVGLTVELNDPLGDPVGVFLLFL